MFFRTARYGEGMDYNEALARVAASDYDGHEPRLTVRRQFLDHPRIIR